MLTSSVPRPGLAVALLVLAAALGGCVDSAPSAEPSTSPAAPSAAADGDGAASDAREPATAVAVGGTNFGLPTVRLLAPAFEAAGVGIGVNVIPGLGSKSGIKAVNASAIDVAVVTRPPKPHEANPNLTYVPLYEDAMVLFAHPDVGVPALTRDELRAILEGRVTTWRDVGGPDVPLTLLVREQDDRELGIFLRHFGLENAAWGEGVRVADNDPEIWESVAATPGALGVTGATPLHLLGLHVEFVAVDGVAYSPQALRDGAYPILARVGLVHRTDAPPAVRAFVDYAIGDEAARILEEARLAGP